MAPRVENPHAPLTPRGRAGTGLARRPRPPIAARPTTTGADRPPPHENAPAVGPRDTSPIRDHGLTLLTVFTLAMLLVVGLATITAIVGRWWILIPVMAVDLALTGAMLASVAKLLNDGDGR